MDAAALGRYYEKDGIYFRLVVLAVSAECLGGRRHATSEISPALKWDGPDLQILFSALSFFLVLGQYGAGEFLGV